MMLWTVSEARAQFATLLATARTQGPQVIRQSGQDDVILSISEASVSGPPMSYLASGRARCDGMEIALEQHRIRMDEYGNRLVAEKHIPPNLSGDVLGWLLRER